MLVIRNGPRPVKSVDAYACWYWVPGLPPTSPPNGNALVPFPTPIVMELAHRPREKLRLKTAISISRFLITQPPNEWTYREATNTAIYKENFKTSEHTLIQLGLETR